MKRECANCGEVIETDCTKEQCPNYYCSDVCADSYHPTAEDVELLKQHVMTINKLEVARGALADIAYSNDMTLAGIKKKAARIYKETE